MIQTELIFNFLHNLNRKLVHCTLLNILTPLCAIGEFSSMARVLNIDPLGNLILIHLRKPYFLSKTHSILPEDLPENLSNL